MSPLDLVFPPELIVAALLLFVIAMALAGDAFGELLVAWFARRRIRRAQALEEVRRPRRPRRLRPRRSERIHIIDFPLPDRVVLSEIYWRVVHDRPQQDA